MNLNKFIITASLICGCVAFANENILEQENAEYYLQQAEIYEQGNGVEQDFSKAVEFYTKAAKMGNSIAMNNLGIMYLEGIGVEQNYKIAKELFDKAYSQGLVDAAKSLGFVYHTGRGVPVDLDKSIEFFLIPAEKGDSFSQNELGVLYQGKQEEKYYKEAIKWYTKAADQNNYLAEFNLAHMYKEGKGVDVDFAKAAKYLALSATKGYVLAQYDLAGMYGSGKGVGKDYVEMYAWLTVAGNIMLESLEYRQFLPSLMSDEDLKQAEEKAKLYYKLFGSHD